MSRERTTEAVTNKTPPHSISPTAPVPLTIVSDARNAKSDVGSSQLVAGVVADAKDFALKYAELLKLDVREELADASRTVIRGSIAATLFSAGALLLATAAALGLAQLLNWPPAAGLLVVGLVVVGLAGVVLQRTVASGRTVGTPKAIDEAEEDIEWIKDNT